MIASTVRIGDGCTACGLCLVTCPEAALRPAPRRPAVIDHRCTGCLACIEVCPRDCIAEWTEDQSTDRVDRPTGPSRGTP